MLGIENKLEKNNNKLALIRRVFATEDDRRGRFSVGKEGGLV